MSKKNQETELPIDEDTFRRYRESSTKQKLNWLESINQLVEKTSDEKQTKLRQKLRDEFL